MVGASVGPFALFAYGPQLGGQPLFSAGGAVFAGKYQNLNSTEAAPVEFSIIGDGTWRASPDLRVNANATWSDLLLSIPGAPFSTNEVQLVDSGAESRVTNGFDSYGSILFHADANGLMEMAWSLQASDTTGVWNLLWNVTDTSVEVIPVTIKSTQPSKPPPRFPMSAPGFK